MTRPNFIPRTLIGCGGVRLFDIPGVIYPDEMLHAKAGTDKKTGRAYKQAPAWGITSQEAARMLGCSDTAARLALHKARVKFRLVHDDQSRRLYWNKTQVEKLVDKRGGKTAKAPAGTVSTQEAITLLGVSRSTIQRYFQNGKLHGVTVRFVLPGLGTRRRTYFKRSEVQRLAKRMNKRRQLEAEILRRMEEPEP